VAQGSGALGLIAGQGALPLAVSRSARGRGRRVAAIAFHGQTDPRLAEGAEVTWLHPGEVGAALAALHAAGVREAVMAGKVPKAGLVGRFEDLRPDAEALRLLGSLRDRRDDSILGTLADFLEERGIHLLSQVDLVPELVGGAGVLGAAQPTALQRADVEFGFPIAKAIAGLDVGQTVVVKHRAVLALEAIEGTDAAIRRAGSIADAAVVVKVAKPSQDPRFDVPTVGPDTLAALRDAKAGMLAFEAGTTLLLEREVLVREADAQGIVMLGVHDAGAHGARA
jgi:DUF1009 family protein